MRDSHKRGINYNKNNQFKAALAVSPYAAGG
jgi:hypothetical protein